MAGGVHTRWNKFLCLKLPSVLWCVPIHFLLKRGVVSQVRHPLALLILVHHTVRGVVPWSDKAMCTRSNVFTTINTFRTASTDEGYGYVLVGHMR